MEAVLRRPRAISLRLRTSPLLLALAILPMLVIVILVSVLVWISFQTGIVGTPNVSYTLHNYVEILGEPFVLKVLWNTIVFTLATTATALILGLPIAWLTERTSLPGKGLVYTIMTLGLLIPGIYTAMGWTFIAHVRIGLLNRWLMDTFGLTEGPINIATPVGMGFVQGLNLTALAFILTAQMFRAMNPALEEAKVVAFKLKDIVEKLHLTHGRPETQQVTVSIGAAELEFEKDSPEEILSHADIALYRAKSQGRNCVILHRKETIAELRAVEQ